MNEIGKALRVLWSTPFLVLGWLVGSGVKVCKLAKAAFVEGYRMGVIIQ